MSKGLRNHKHVFCEDKSVIYYDKYFRCLVKKTYYRCYMPNCNCHYVDEEFLSSRVKKGES